SIVETKRVPHLDEITKLGTIIEKNESYEVRMEAKGNRETVEKCASLLEQFNSFNMHEDVPSDSEKWKRKQDIRKLEPKTPLKNLNELELGE
ncbi:unnamed protein product, partial [Didymodactylos carnosus]